MQGGLSPTTSLRTLTGNADWCNGLMNKRSILLEVVPVGSPLVAVSTPLTRPGNVPTRCSRCEWSLRMGSRFWTVTQRLGDH